MWLAYLTLLAHPGIKVDCSFFISKGGGSVSPTSASTSYFVTSALSGLFVTNLIVECHMVTFLKIKNTLLDIFRSAGPISRMQNYTQAIQV